MPSRFILLLLVALVSAVRFAEAQPPSPLDPTLFAFPGGSMNPPSAANAGLAGADQWLGDEPFYNPSTPGGRLVSLSPTLLRVSRQDLRAENRNFDDNPLFFDFSGAAVAIPGVPVWVYVFQPGLRFEDYVFNRGTGTDPTVQPAVITGQSDMREGRAGISGSLPLGRMRGGFALEWTRRQDRYFVREQSGSPDQGDRELSFEGDAFGYNIGWRYDSADSGTGRLTVGAAVRWLASLEVDADQTLSLLSGDSVAVIPGEREAGYEAGLSARYFFTPAFAGLAAVGMRTEQEWKGFDVTAGAFTMWRVGIQFHDSRDPWTARLAFGMDNQDDVPEPSANVLGLGFGWNLEGIQLDLGLQHSSIERGDEPRSYEDRLVGTVVVGF
jgi:hypothetical protein